MLQLTGQWYDGTGSERTEVRLQLDNHGLLSIYGRDSGELLHSVNQQQVEVSSRLANSPRYLNLPDGQSVETLDNDQVDQWIELFRPGRFTGLLHRLESHLGFVLVTLVLVIGVVWGTAQFGVPAASHAVARALPAELLDRASEETLLMMDQHWLQPSKLDPERQQQLQSHFAKTINAHHDLRIKVDFRDCGKMGANAFALPNGQIIFTDAIVRLAEHDDELLAILAHEIGHVEHRHSMRRLVQNSLYVFLLSMITGDISGTAEIVLGLPLVFAELAYSRSYETEADHYALEFLQEHDIAPHRFSDLMLRMEATRKEKQAKNKPDRVKDEEEQQSWSRYLSTHPLTEERIKAFQSANN
ncbi:MAG: M48 family metallopeptidase [Motiliproteus sp.]|nr:M48 family metallopeptidase [Motiliproteus sp.]MCW9051326.1 M48 family metallopeptidase [Motiliproteus sp.]